MSSTSYIGGDPQKRYLHEEGTASAEFFYLPETSGKLVSMQGGNQAAHATRNLSMRAKEYWETRPSPAMPHHWTADEFAAHLERHRYPGGTISDRMRGHELAIRRALVCGEFVPAEVMATEEGRSALADASMEIKSLDEGAFRQAQQSRAIAQFDAIADCSVIENLVVGGAKLAAQAQGAEPQSMSVEKYPRAVWCVAVDNRVLIKDTGWNYASLYGVIQEVDRAVAESIVAGALRDGRLTYDESLWFMGSDWTPYALVRDCSPAPR